MHHLVGGWARNPLLYLIISSHVFIGVHLGPSAQPIPPDFGVCGNACQSSRDVRGNAHPVCLFNARVVSSWKLRNLELVGRITRRS